MSNKKYAYNYDIEECNQLFKRGYFLLAVASMIKQEMYSLCFV